MSDRLQELTVFIRTAESGSFSQAARELGLSQPSVSRVVNELEERLGVKLLLRSTRRVVPTDAGATFLEHARGVIRGLEAAEDAARGMDSLNGTIRIAVPITLGLRLVIPRLPSFLEAHPHLSVDVLMSDERQDLVAQGVDVAVRMTVVQLADSNFGARRLATVPRILVASPEYLQRRGVPKSSADLPSHDCVFGPGGTSRQGWAFVRDGAVVSVRVEGRLQVASAEGVIASVKAGLGIAIAGSWMCRDELRVGTLVHVLKDHVMEPAEVHAIYPAGPHPSLRVRALVDHLAATLSPLVEAEAA